MIEALRSYIVESIEELKKVNWLSFSEARDMTVLVILFSLTVAAILGLLDAVFANIIVGLK